MTFKPNTIIKKIDQVMDIPNHVFDFVEINAVLNNSMDTKYVTDELT